MGAGLIASVVLAIAPGSERTAATETSSGRGSGDPNVIVVMTDDQGLNTFSKRTMPHTFKLAQGGAGAELQGYASPPLCCPARAGFLTGQYPHNHGVLQNDWRFLRDPDNTLPAWLQNAGYRTGLVGKYMNEYKPSPAPAEGWNRWFELMEPVGYFNFQVSDQGVIESRGDNRRDYSTSLVTEESLRFIRAQADKPFFLWTSYFAPHIRGHQNDPNCGTEAPIPLPEDWDEVAGDPVALSRSYNEQDVRDKPKAVRRLGRLPRDYASTVKARVRCTEAALAEVDNGVRKITSTLRKLKIDDDTVIIFLSDNGSFFGEHRIAQGKSLPYVEAVRVPMIVHVPPKVLDAGHVTRRISEPITNFDLAPTILQLAGAQPCTAGGECRVMDGRSIVPLLRGNDGGWPAQRPIGMNLRRYCRGYQGVFRGNESYIEWFGRVHGDCRTPERELYDLRNDPNQLENRLHRPSGGAVNDAARLEGLVDRLMACAGIEGRDPQQAGRPFCL